jgi:hypothetical protein
MPVSESKSAIKFRIEDLRASPFVSKLNLDHSVK